MSYLLKYLLNGAFAMNAVFVTASMTALVFVLPYRGKNSWLPALYFTVAAFLANILAAFFMSLIPDYTFFVLFGLLSLSVLYMLFRLGELKGSVYQLPLFLYALGSFIAMQAYLIEFPDLERRIATGSGQALGLGFGIIVFAYIREHVFLAEAPDFLKGLPYLLVFAACFSLILKGLAIL